MKKIYFGMALVASILVGCTTSTLEEAESRAPQDYKAIAEASEHISYTLETMQSIADRINATGASIPRLTPTKRYMAFYPTNSQEFKTILNRSDINWSGASILEEIVLPEGCNYTSPEESDEAGALYAFIETGTPLPQGIACEVLQEYYNPFHDRTGNMDNETAATMMELADKMNPKTRAGMISPTGIIVLTENSSIRSLPLEGLTMQLRYSDDNGTIVQEYVTTDSLGRYKAKLYYPGRIDFTIDWKHGNYIIKNGLTAPAVTTGYIGEDNADFYFQSGNAAIYRYASIYRGIYAASKYGLPDINYNGPFEIMCFTQPTPSGWSDAQLCPSGAGREYDHIRVFCAGKESLDILSPLFEALGLADYSYNRELSIPRNEIIQNSYCMFTRSYFLDREYSRIRHLSWLHEQEVKNGKTYIRPDQYNLQDWTVSNSADRFNTPLFIDLYDDFDQAEYYGDDLGGSRPTDYICINDFATVRDIALHSSSIAEAMNLTRAKAAQFGFRTGDVSLLHYTYQQLE